jgi:opacity protein-like surface antigen
MKIAMRSGRFVLALCVMTASPLWAQPALGPIVSGAVSGIAIDENAGLAFSGAAGYRFNRAFGMGVEILSMPSLEIGRPGPLSGNGIRIDYADPSTRLTVFTANVRLEVPTTSQRVLPYVVAGGGIASVQERVDVIIAIETPFLTIPEIRYPTIYPPPTWSPYVFSSTELALTFGGGVSLPAGGHFSVDVDLRYLRLVADRDRNVGRFGLGASYRF